MTTVMATTDALPELNEILERRRREGRDTYDEWWDGVYRVVTGPTPEHGRIAVRVAAFLDRLLADRDLLVSAPVNIGVDKQDARVPDIGVLAPDTERTSPAFVRRALLAVEVLSRGERPGARLDFYSRWNVQEYLEIDLSRRVVRLLVRTDAAWTETAQSPLGFRIEGDCLVAEDADDRYCIDWPARR